MLPIPNCGWCAVVESKPTTFESREGIDGCESGTAVSTSVATLLRFARFMSCGMMYHGIKGREGGHKATQIQIQIQAQSDSCWCFIQRRRPLFPTWNWHYSVRSSTLLCLALLGVQGPTSRSRLCPLYCRNRKMIMLIPFLRYGNW